MKITTSLAALILFLLTCCANPEKQKPGNTFYGQTAGLPALDGKTQYLASPFVTAGDRVYMVGHQDGTFPDLGWHIDGEMGGIWDHPIKLMDGFSANIAVQGSQESYCLDKANKFTNFPMANKHHFTWDKEKLTIERFQFVPDSVEGAIVEFRIVNQGNAEKEIAFSFTGRTDLRPTWLGERTNMNDAEDEITFDKKLSAVIAKDKNNPWYTAFGSLLPTNRFSENITTCLPTAKKGLGKNATLLYSLRLKPNEEKVIPFFIAGSYKSEAALRSTYQALKTEGENKLTQKINRYKKINRTSHLTIPDKNLAQMYEWLKYNSDWLVRHVPEQGIGISAGLPDYPWWFGADATYTLQGLLATGDHETAKNTIKLLHRLSERTNGNGRIIHEVSTNGAVYNPGNVNETAQFINLLRVYFAWTGDKELMQQLFPAVKKGITWLREVQDPDGNGYPNGNGMMEIPGLDTEMIDVAVYTQQALAAAAELASALGEHQTAAGYQRAADTLKVRINQEWWNEADRSFGDFRGTVAEARPILRGALIRADTLGKPWAVAELKQTEKQFSKYPPGQHRPYVVYRNWVVNTPLETGVADVDKGQAALQTAKKYENPFGVFVTGIDRTEEPDSVVLKSRKKTFSYTGAVMTLPTGVQAVAAANYGNPEEVLQYLAKLQQSFSYALPGSMYEVSPDFGMVTQAWNIYAVAVPIVNHLFGIQPKAYEKVITLSPRLPAAWKNASLANVRVGSNSLSLAFSRKKDYQEYRIRQTQPDWTVLLNVKNARKVIVDKTEINLKTITRDKLKLNKEAVIVRIY